MRVVSGERHHAAGDGQVIVLPGQAAVDLAAFPNVELEAFQLRVGPLAGRPLRQIGPVQRPVGHETVRSSSCARPYKPKPSRFERAAAPRHMPSPRWVICSPITRGPNVLEQRFQITGVVAEIGHDERVVVIAAIDRGQRIRSRAAVEAERKFFKLAEAHQGGLERAAATHHGRGPVPAAADIMGDDAADETLARFPADQGAGPSHAVERLHRQHQRRVDLDGAIRETSW